MITGYETIEINFIYTCNLWQELRPSQWSRFKEYFISDIFVNEHGVTMCKIHTVTTNNKASKRVFYNSLETLQTCLNEKKIRCMGNVYPYLFT